MVDIILKESRLNDFSRKDAEDFLSFTRIENYSQGDVILQEGSVGDIFCIIADGEVGISKEVNQQVAFFITTLHKGEFFGEMSLVSSYPRSANAVANGDVKLIVLDRFSMEKLKSEHPILFGKFSWHIAKTLSERLFRLEERISKILDASLSENIL
ncbi:Crp/Fnr family transcriptional regulator [Limisalsivibrio acetivorans]|uniref:Crp/Fnr family transcriptional regulator n=1 Tax=Limisalsivibrio acetivorans TaxID=1304888 RepID=UPI00058E3E63|nr:cyclic nucleotide-binding domain-containing protein [Limisalsivibrio acetivorans]